MSSSGIVTTAEATHWCQQQDPLSRRKMQSI
jgi:hypothetical protein